MSEDTKLDQKDITAFRNEFEAIEAEVRKSVIGYPETVRQILVAFFADGHVLLEGVPGVGKTHLVKTLSRVLGLSFSRIQFTPDLMPADIVGTDMLIEEVHGGRRMEFRPGPVFTHILLADEVNRAMPKTQSALLEAMAEHQVTAGGETRPLSPPFFVLATQNPLEMEGTYPLPEAQIDRFFFKLLIPYPDREELSRIVDLTTGSGNFEFNANIALARSETDAWWQEKSDTNRNDDGTHEEKDLNPDEKAYLNSLRQRRVAYLRRVVRGVLIDPAAREFLLKIIMATHEESVQRRHRWFGGDEEREVGAKRYIEYGASPRGAQALVLAAKVMSLLSDRAIVTIEDVQAVVLPALRHRLILNFEAEAEERRSDDLLSQIIERITS